MAGAPSSTLDGAPDGGFEFQKRTSEFPPPFPEFKLAFKDACVPATLISAVANVNSRVL